MFLTLSWCLLPQYVHTYTPDVLDIPTHLQPFIPEYVPIVGLPFDGIQVRKMPTKSNNFAA
jgi:hypothetical protein